MVGTVSLTCTKAVKVTKTLAEQQQYQKRSPKSLNKKLFGYDGVVSTARNTPCVRIIKEPSVSGDAVLVFRSALLSPHD